MGCRKIREMVFNDFVRLGVLLGRLVSCYALLCSAGTRDRTLSRGPVPGLFSWSWVFILLYFAQLQLSGSQYLRIYRKCINLST